MLLPPPFSQFCVKLLLIVVAIDVILCQSFNAEEVKTFNAIIDQLNKQLKWEETKLAKQLDDCILDPSLSIKIRPKVGTTKPISFIMGAVFAKRRCKGLFSTDKIQLQYNSHFISVENVRCGANHKHMREIPLQNIHTEDYENRALEFVFSAPLDLSRTDRNLRQTQIWGVPSEQAHSKRIKFSDIDCGRVLLANDTAYVEQRAKSPLSFSDPGDTLPVNCASIRGRHFHFSQQPKDRSSDYPLAFIRLVYTDYLFIEMEFASSYAPQNWYCYAIDKKASQTFHMQIYALASCFPNVLITPIEKQYDMDSKGHNYMKSSIECMQMLEGKHWHYAIMLQNHDVQMKTNEELVQIFKWMNGTNDIQYTKIGSHHVDFAKHSWTLSHLKLFRNASKNSDNLKLKKSKGTSEMSLSRKFVDWLLNDLDTSVMLDQLNSYNYANDEYFIQTLASNGIFERARRLYSKMF
uniref:Uncharacterized protein n=1 Tax=Globodera rostochiensis TaxID=31243 RepID=A0A914I292_GLORO